MWRRVGGNFFGTVLQTGTCYFSVLMKSNLIFLFLPRRERVAKRIVNM